MTSDQRKGDDNKLRLLETVDPDIQDLIEWRLHSHAESSLGMIGEKIERLSAIIEAHDDILKKQDKVLTSANMDTLLGIIKKAQDDEIIRQNNIRMGNEVIKTGKLVILVASVIAALGYIADWVIVHVIAQIRP